MKKCQSCNTKKKNTDFYKCSMSKDGLHSYCKICSNESKKKHYANNKKEIIRKVNLYNKTRDSGLYTKYLSMKRRCTQKSYYGYKWYAEKGIRVEWNSYQEFKKDMYDSYLIHREKQGHKQTTLERIDPNKNYCKENCKWATLLEQGRNKTNSLYNKSL